VSEAIKSDAARKLMRQNVSTLHQAVGQITQAMVAERTGLTPTIISRVLSGKDSEDETGGALHRIMAILAGCNLRVSPATWKPVDPDEYRAMQVLAQKRLTDPDAPPSDWGVLT
jgi:hypothetical protein